MLNYFNHTEFDDGVLLTNDFGKYAFLTKEEFSLLMRQKLPKESSIYLHLRDSFFLFDTDKELFLQNVLSVSRSSRAHLFDSTSLFIFVLTNQCNLDCVYCQARSFNSKTKGSMDKETARKAVDIVFSSASQSVTIEFQGGEPLLNFPCISFIVKYAEKCAEEKGKTVSFSLVSNLSLLTNEMLDFFIYHSVNISTSLDGDRLVHNHNRPMKNSESSFDACKERIAFARNKGLNLGAIETTTRITLSNPKALVDTYVKNGFKSIFLRPLTPLGIASERWSEIGYAPDEFISFYKEALDYIIELNKKRIMISEGYASIFLRKILNNEGCNYMELRSPCGAAIGQMAFYFDGKVFSCDEGRMAYEMGIDEFQLGTVDDGIDDLLGCSVCKTLSVSSVLESLPNCVDCVFQPYCGVCPVVNYMSNGSVFSKTPKDYRCRIYHGMLDVIFHYLKENDSAIMNVLREWPSGL